MSFGWTVTDPRIRKEQPWRFETFHGYFTDIQRAARRSLPRRPNKDLCSLLGLSQSFKEPSTAGRVSTRIPPPIPGPPPSAPPKDLVPVVLSPKQPPDSTFPEVKKVVVFTQCIKFDFTVDCDHYNMSDYKNPIQNEVVSVFTLYCFCWFFSNQST